MPNTKMIDECNADIAEATAEIAEAMRIKAVAPGYRKRDVKALEILAKDKFFDLVDELEIEPQELLDKFNFK